MTNITIGNESFYVKDNWFEITYAEAKRVFDIEIPPKLKKLYLAKNKETFDELAKNQDDNLPYFKAVISEMAGVPMELLDKTTVGIEYFYHSYLERLIIDLQRMYPMDYRVMGQREFTIGKQTFHFPIDKNILNDVRHFDGESVGAVLESLDINANLKGIGLSGLLGIAAIFLRPKGEKYDENEALKRIEIFKTLPMSVIWELFFFLFKVRRYNR